MEALPEAARPPLLCLQKVWRSCHCRGSTVVCGGCVRHPCFMQGQPNLLLCPVGAAHCKLHCLFVRGVRVTPPSTICGPNCWACRVHELVLSTCAICLQVVPSTQPRLLLLWVHAAFSSYTVFRAVSASPELKATFLKSNTHRLLGGWGMSTASVLWLCCCLRDVLCSESSVVCMSVCVCLVCMFTSACCVFVFCLLCDACA